MLHYPIEFAMQRLAHASRWMELTENSYMTTPGQRDRHSDAGEDSEKLSVHRKVHPCNGDNGSQLDVPCTTFGYSEAYLFGVYELQEFSRPNTLIEVVIPSMGQSLLHVWLF